MNAKSIIGATALLTGLMACGSILNKSPLDEHASGTKQLVNDDFVCEAKSERSLDIMARYNDQLIGGSSAHRQTAISALTTLPDEYLRYVLDAHNLKIELRNASGSTRGMTTSTNSGSGWYPSEMWVAPKTGNFDPLPHEMGHATEHYLTKSFPNFQSDLAKAYSAARSGKESQLMRGYALSTQKEYFAEAFDSYYCSQASRKMMREKMPKTWSFARKYLIDPNALEADLPQIDSDDDGVYDYKDRCPDTPKDAHVWKKESGPEAKWLGCTEGQTPLAN
jgi:hypothetical protein